VHGSNARNLSVKLSLSQLAKTLCLSYCLCLLSSTKLEKRAEQILPGSKGLGDEKGQGTEGRNDPNNVCSYEYVNKEKRK
jgi:hypothetical protein